MIDQPLANLVRDRAGDRCEYCLLRQQDDRFFRFHIEHIIPKQHGGRDESENLALACHQCNLHKGPNLAGIDPDTDTITPLFHPRRQDWQEHFEIRGIRIAGKTAIGRATIVVLNINSVPRLDLRAQLLVNGRWL
jgi:hypothetical protein